MSMNIASRARNVARIFDILAWVVLVFGVLGAGIYFLVAVAAGAQDDNLIVMLDPEGNEFCLET